ncbi:MAG: hypothetical protein ABIQ95_14315 [Bdellovibrionia bacterium]
MRTTPFDVPPLGKFLFRLVGPTIAWLLLCWGITGLLYPSFWLSKPSQISSISFDPDGWIQLYRDLEVNLSTPPGICKPGQELRDVESTLCQEFNSLLREREIMVLTPWGILLAVLVLSLYIFQSYYRSAAAQIREGKVKYVGQVLGAPRGASSAKAATPGLSARGESMPTTKSKAKYRTTFFDRFYFFKPIEVLLPNKVKVTAYLGQELERAKKGQSVIVYETRSVFAGKRYLGVLDNPHIAVFHGS